MLVIHRVNTAANKDTYIQSMMTFNNVVKCHIGTGLLCLNTWFPIGGAIWEGDGTFTKSLARRS